MKKDNLLCSIYRNNNQDEMYLYVPKVVGLSEVPEALLKIFDCAHHSMDILLTADKRLARAKAMDILAAIAAQGFYLQMPPARDAQYAGLRT